MRTTTTSTTPDLMAIDLAECRITSDTAQIRTADLSRTRHTYRCTPGAWVSHPQSPAEGA